MLTDHNGELCVGLLCDSVQENAGPDAAEQGGLELQPVNRH